MTDTPDPDPAGSAASLAPDEEPVDQDLSVEEEQPAPASRAGRDLRAAIGVGVGLGLLVLVSLLFYKPSFVVVVAAAVGLGVWEMRRAVATAGLLVPLPPLLLGTVSMVASAYVQGGDGLLVSFGLTVVALLVWRAADGLAGAARDLGAAILLTLYPGLLAGFAVLMLTPADGVRRMIVFLLVTVASDIGGYAVGVLIGRHPMAPSVSPKKSWEGFTGSVSASAAIGAVSLVLLLDGPWWAGAVMGALAAAAATLGDLIESTIKRDLGVKDMGTILPGHGGLMDRLDSLVIVAPLVWAILRFVVPLS